MRSLLFFLLFYSLSLPAQFTVRGYVVDATSGEYLPYASVFLHDNQSKGVLTNEKGEYLIELTEEERRTSRLVFSLLSYEPEERPLSQLPIDGEETYVNVRMSTQFLDLPEVVVLSDLGLRAMVKRALALVPDNYGTDEYLLRAYSRNYAVNDSAFTNLYEAYVTVKDVPYGPQAKKRPPRVWINQLRAQGGTAAQAPAINEFFDRQSFLVGPYAWMSNPIRTGSLTSFFDEDFIEQLTFQRTGQYRYGSDTLVRLRFEVAADAGSIPPGSYYGELLINTTDEAILEYKFWTRGRKVYSDAMYQKIDGKYFVKRASMSWDFETDFRDVPSLYHTFFYVNEVITDPRAIKRTKKGRYMQLGDPLSSLKIRHRPEFWGGEERMLQLPAREAVRVQLEKIMGGY